MYEEDSRAWSEMWCALLLIVIMYNRTLLMKLG